MTALAALNDAPYARTVVSSWFSKPLSSPHRVARALISLRSLMNPAQSFGLPVQARTFALLTLSLEQLRAAFAEAEQAPAISEDLRGQVTSAIQIAEDITQHLYFASGAFSQENPSRPATPVGDLGRFSAFALPLLDALSAIHHPAVTHHIVETIDHIGATEPKRAFLIAAKAVTQDPAYPREVLALDATVGLIRHYTADHRSLALGDLQCATAIRTMLEAFVRLGWDKAIQLAEELDELFL